MTQYNINCFVHMQLWFFQLFQYCVHFYYETIQTKWIRKVSATISKYIWCTIKGYGLTIAILELVKIKT